VVAQQANIILVNSSFPAKTLDELKKADGEDKLAFASPGAGTTPASHRGEPVPRALEADVTHVPSRAPAPRSPAC
jgi:tripartite-type tricarboxylate transporter receptor subunit TctC